MYDARSQQDIEEAALKAHAAHIIQERQLGNNEEWKEASRYSRETLGMPNVFLPGRNRHGVGVSPSRSCLLVDLTLDQGTCPRCVQDTRSYRAVILAVRIQPDSRPAYT